MSAGNPQPPQQGGGPKRAWPGASQFNEAVQNLATTMADGELQGGAAELNALGMPMPYAGNFADVYKVHCPKSGNTWAVKFFKREVRDLQERYRLIGEQLIIAQLPFTVDFRYLAEGVRIGGAWYPLVKMRWIEGQSLHRFVAESFDRPKALDQLFTLWVKLAERLRGPGIAHADLQHGNVVLVPGEEGRLLLKLIDYDGMFVPALAGQGTAELGHANYQHPQREQTGAFNAELDRFAHLVICCALKCLRVGGLPLWERFNTGENLLFTARDFREPNRSKLFRELWSLKQPDARALVGYLALATQQPLEQTPLLSEIIHDGRVQPLTREQVERVYALLAAETVVTPTPSVAETAVILPPAAVEQPPAPPRPIPVPAATTDAIVAAVAKPAVAEEQPLRRSWLAMGAGYLLAADRFLISLVGEENQLLHHFVRVVAVVLLLAGTALAWRAGQSLWQGEPETRDPQRKVAQAPDEPSPEEDPAETNPFDLSADSELMEGVEPTEVVVEPADPMIETPEVKPDPVIAETAPPVFNVAAVANFRNLAHLRFDGDGRDVDPQRPAAKVENVEFRENAAYLNGIYRTSFVKSSPGSLLICNAPDLDYKAFTVGVRFKADELDLQKEVNGKLRGYSYRLLLNGGESYRWFTLRVDGQGALYVTFDQWEVSRKVPDAKIVPDQWTTILCAVDLTDGKLDVYVDGRQHRLNLPLGHSLRVASTSEREKDKQFIFHCGGSGDAFHGLVDELVVFDEALDFQSVAKLTPDISWTAADAKPVDAGHPLGAKVVYQGGYRTWFSPDGKQLAVSRQTGGIDAIEVATGEVTRLLATGKDPAWRPRKPDQIAYVEVKAGHEEIWLVDLPDGKPRKILTGGFPTWSGDGSLLYFQARTRNKILGVNVDGAFPEVKVEIDSTPHYYPAVSPDGKRVAAQNGPELLVTEVATKKVLRKRALPAWTGLIPSWSPDSKLVSFGSYGLGNQKGLWLLDIDTGKEIEVVAGDYTCGIWSPDGQGFAFDFRPNGRWNTLFVDAKMLPKVD